MRKMQESAILIVLLRTMAGWYGGKNENCLAAPMEKAFENAVTRDFIEDVTETAPQDDEHMLGTLCMP